MKQYFENENINEVNNQNENVNPTVQDEMEQANTGASPVNYFKPMSIPGGASKAQPAPGYFNPASSIESEAEKVSTNSVELSRSNEVKTVPKTELPQNQKKALSKTKKTPDSDKELDYSPQYDDMYKIKLEKLTKLHEIELERIAQDERYCVLRDCNNKVVGVDLTATVKKGIKLYKLTVNRVHGNDEKLTGLSIMRYGAQEALTIVSVKVALENGLELEAFDNTEGVDDAGLAVVNGIGRTEFLSKIDINEWPRLLATFVQPDNNGLIDPCTALAEMNINVCKWKTQDMVQKRLMKDGNEAHIGFKKIHELVKNGYKYQAACHACTLRNDRIKVRDVNEGSANEIFEHYQYAITIHGALVNKFGEGDDKILKTKEFPKRISELWRKLMTIQGAEWATDKMLVFIEGITPEQVDDLLNTPREKDGVKRDDLRKNKLNMMFDWYRAKNDIEF